MRVNCGDCNMNFHTKKLYINHVKSKECSRNKRSSSSSSPQASKKPRLEINSSNNISQPQVSSLQSQISQLSQRQRDQLKVQLKQKRHVLKEVPFNQLPEKQKETLIKLTKNTSMHNKNTVVITKNTDTKQRPSSVGRKVYGRNNDIIEDDLPVVSEFFFSDEPIALDDDELAALKPDNKAEDDGEAVDFGNIKIKSYSRMFKDVSNALDEQSTKKTTPTSKLSEKPVTPRATLKETCPYCRKIFSKTGMIQHIEFKHKSKCDHCDYKCVAEDLEKHVESEHMVVCKYCQTNKRILKTELQGHVFRDHMENCTKCCQRFLKIDLPVHVRNIHEKEACNECDSRFETKEVLATHLDLVHFTEKCDECSEAFKTETDLEEHKISKHPKEYCEEADCDAVFAVKEDLEKHKEKVHPNPNKFINFTGGMFMMMTVEDEVMEENNDDEEAAREESVRLEMEREEAKEKARVEASIRELLIEIGDDVVKTAMTGTILFALRIEN